ncbi:MAG: molybdopterin molybdotransferase MoeA, partial [Bacteroidetes bacterium]|nr:molybdopterin molybdotransferase MoeA [Bacteroidota bacterium]
MISFDNALSTVLASLSALGKEKVSLPDAHGRILFEDVVAKEHLPPFDNSSMDGYAVRWTDIREVSRNSPVSLLVVGEASAGHVFAKPIRRLEAIRVTTGGMIPRGADTVVPLEHALLVDENHVRVIEAPRKGGHIRTAGRELRAGERVLQSGDTIGSLQMGLLASLGVSRIRVYKRPTVKIFATGDELVRVEDKPGRGQIRSGTPFSLAGYIRAAGGEPELCGILPDKRKRLRKGIRDALPSDIVLTIGGVSTGKYDLVRGVLEDLGARILFWQVNMKPGRRMVFANLDGTLVFGLPGNVASTVITFLQFVRPVLWRMTGQAR